MTSLDAIVAETFVYFCRIGLCLAFAPGFSSPRIAMRIRLYLAIGLTLALQPTLARIAPLSATALGPALPGTIVVECLIGATLGLMVRLFVAAFETMAVAIAMSTGTGSIMGQRVDESEAMPELATFLSLSVTTLIFVADLHWEMIRALADSYRTFPVGAGFSAEFALGRLTAALSEAFPITLRIASPFLVFGLVVNFAFGLLNKVAPQISAFFISVPFLILGGLALAYTLSGEMMSIFLNSLADFLTRG